MTLFVLILSLLFALPGALYADTYRLAPQGHVMALPQAVGKEWVLLLPPDSLIDNPTFGSYQFNGLEYGLAVVDQRQPMTWTFAQGAWSPFEIHNGIHDFNLRFCLMPNGSVWYGIGSEIAYKHNLAFWNGHRNSTVKTPNTAGIRSIWFDEGQGWCGCDWGQILRYDGDTWKQVPCPTLQHVNNLLPLGGGEWLAKTDDDHKFLRYDGTAWAMDPSGAQLTFPQFVLSHLYIKDNCIDNPYGLQLLHAAQSYFKSSCPVDTLRLPSHVPMHGLIWVHRTQPVTGMRNVLRKDFYQASEKAVVFIFCESDTVDAAGRHCATYARFTRVGLHSRIVLEIPPYVKPQQEGAYFRVGSRSANYEHGICFSDLTGDGHEDKYAVVTASGNRLNVYRLNMPGGDENYNIEIAEEAGLSGGSRTDKARVLYDEGCASADIDNDGDQDMLVTALYGGNVLYKQVSRGRFEEMADLLGLPQHSIGFSMNGAWGDINNDGHIDLYISNEDSTNRMYFNNGAGFFSDVTVASGLLTARGGGGSALADVDGDGDLDCFVPRRGVRDLFYENCGIAPGHSYPIFRECGVERGVAGADTIAHSVCGVFEDLDNDGDLDLYVCNMTGPNGLYRNDGFGHFKYISAASGLDDAGMSMSAVFLDADHDGYLDAYVGNRGQSRYYENRGDMRFVEATARAGAGYNGFLTGLAVWDREDDGDIDIFLSDGKGDSHGIINKRNDGRFIGLRLVGTTSNRDAVGARAWLYPGGQIGNADSLLALRHVASGGNYNGMNARRMHFGIPDGRAKDLLIRFPSGIEQRLYNVKPGQYYTIEEQSGWARARSLHKKWVARNLRSPLNRREALFGVAFFAVLALMHLLWIRRIWWRHRIALLSFVLPMVVFLLFFLPARNPFSLSSHLAPVGASLLFMTGGLFYGRRIWGGRGNETEVMEKLFFMLKGFFHGGWGARKFNRLMLYCSNLEPGVPISKAMREKLEESIRDYYHLLLPELERVIDHAATLPSTHRLCGPLEQELLVLSDALNQLNVSLKLNRVEPKILDSVRQKISGIKEMMDTLRQAINAQFATEVCQALKGLCEAEHLDLTMTEPGPSALWAMIRPVEFSQIMQNLIDNARAAVTACTHPQIGLCVRANIERIEIQIADNGSGVPDEFIPRLFREQRSSRSDSGGFGLYMSAQILRKYGGQIQLLQNGPVQETVFQIQLKRMHHAG